LQDYALSEINVHFFSSAHFTLSVHHSSSSPKLYGISK